MPEGGKVENKKRENRKKTRRRGGRGEKLDKEKELRREKDEGEGRKR
jgi:hypothetical protein